MESKKTNKISWKMPKQGYMFNPMLTLPRNEPCPCQSGKKFKKCHLNKLAHIVPTPGTLRAMAEQERLKKESENEKVSLETQEVSSA